MVMTFVLHPLSHYNSIIVSRARFLLSLLEYLTIDFPSHFILSIINVFRDTVTHDKLIFPLANQRILCHFSVPFLVFDHFHVMCVIDAATVKQSEAQLHSRQSGLAAPPTPLSPSTFAPSFSAKGVTLDMIMAQLQRMDARLDTLTTELYQVNTRVNRIARRQARLGWSLLLLNPRHSRTMMTPTTKMMIRIVMLALPMLMRCLLDTLTMCHL